MHKHVLAGDKQCLDVNEGWATAYHRCRGPYELLACLAALLPLHSNKGRYEMNNSYQFWQQDNQRIESGTYDVFRTIINYLHENFVRVGFVWRWVNTDHY